MGEQIYVTRSKKPAMSVGGLAIPHVAVLLGTARWHDAVIRRAYEEGWNTFAGMSGWSFEHRERLLPWLRHRGVVTVLPGDEARAEKLRFEFGYRSYSYRKWGGRTPEHIFASEGLWELIAREGKRWDGHTDAKLLWVAGEGRRNRPAAGHGLGRTRGRAIPRDRIQLVGLGVSWDGPTPAGDRCPICGMRRLNRNSYRVKCDRVLADG